MLQPRPRVIIADDHPMFAQGVAKILEPECDLMGVATTGRELLAMLERDLPDLVIADISMPDLNGLDAVRLLRQKWPELPVIFLTMHTDVQYAHAAYSLGALGYVPKRSAASVLLDAMRSALSGRVFIPSELVDQLIQLEDTKDDEILTPRQREVLQLVAEGQPAKEIAHMMGISVKTVEFHKSCIMQKLGVHSTAELTKFAIEHGLTSTSS